VRFATLFVAAALSILPAFADEAPGSKSIFLVAKKDLPDPFFRDSVVLVTNASIAPIGVIINKPLDVKLSKALPKLEKLQSREEKLYFGGPVAASDVVFIFRSKKPVETALRLMDGVYLTGSREILDTLLARDKPLDGVRIFAGHAGWSPGQLETEISRGDWDLLPAEEAAIFATKPEALWPELHRRASATKARFVR
jgi:putative transcriptional regulator